MRYAKLTQRIAGDGAAAWDIHYRALALQAEGKDILLLSVGDPDFDTPRQSSKRPSAACVRATPIMPMCAASWRCARPSPSATNSAAARPSAPTR